MCLILFTFAPMRKYKTYNLSCQKSFFTHLLNWAKKNKNQAFYNSNNYTDIYKSLDFVVGVGAKNQFEINDTLSFKDIEKHFVVKDWYFGFFTYDVKNFIEKLNSNNMDGIQMPTIHFFCPELVFLCKDSELTIGYFESQYNEFDIGDLFQKIINYQSITHSKLSVNLSKRISYAHYINQIEQIKHHIQIGDIYEMNYCMEFYAKNIQDVSPNELYAKLNEQAPAPFSSLYVLNDKALICSSPERYLKKEGATLISQPIKGTIKRGHNESEDAYYAYLLKTSEKERSENIMIVDLVRNDLSRIAKINSVVVDELCGIYTYPTVHQMISTIKTELDTPFTFFDAIQASFPPGSMTGAPKIRAMELIEQFEETKRGLYAGSLGYITPEGDADFNVVIRSILLNSTHNYLSFHVGGAITHLSDPHNEYEECLLKAQALIKVLS